MSGKSLNAKEGEGNTAQYPKDDLQDFRLELFNAIRQLQFLSNACFSLVEPPMHTVDSESSFEGLGHSLQDVASKLQNLSTKGQ